MYLLHKVGTHPCMSKCGCTECAYIDTSVHALLHRIRKHRYMRAFRLLWVRMITLCGLSLATYFSVDFEGDKAAAISDWKRYAVPHCATFTWQDILTEGGGGVGSSKGHLTPCSVSGSSYQNSAAADHPLFIKQWNRCQRQKVFSRIHRAEMKINFDIRVYLTPEENADINAGWLLKLLHFRQVLCAVYWWTATAVGQWWWWEDSSPHWEWSWPPSPPASSTSTSPLEWSQVRLSATRLPTSHRRVPTSEIS